MTRSESLRRFEGDTSREALRVQYAALRRMPVAKRLALMDGLTVLEHRRARSTRDEP